MSLLKNLNTNDSIQGEQDRLGGGGAIASAIYPVKIDLSFINVSEEKTDPATGKVTGGAMSITTIYKTAEGKEINDTQFVTGGADKGKKNTYTDSKGADQYLPGFLIMEAVAMLAAGVPLNQLESEEKMVEVYDFQAKAKVPKKVQVITSLIGKELNLGVLRVIQNKKAKQQNGSYSTTNDKVTVNEVNKVFCARAGWENFTVAEIKAKKADASVQAKFFDDWKKKYDGQDVDRFKEVTGAAAAGGAKTSSGATAPATSLFGN